MSTFITGPNPSPPLEAMPANAYVTETDVEGELNTVVACLLDEVNPRGWERRADVRHPFDRPITATLDDGSCFPAFTRNLSSRGIGLQHAAPLESGNEVTLHIPRQSGDPVHIRIEIVWCQPFANGWYTSGGKFRGVV